jgi:hypothetical protein
VKIERKSPERPERSAKAGGKKVDKQQAPAAASPWSVPIMVTEVPETGRRIELVPDETQRKAIAAAAGLIELPRLQAAFDLVRHGTDSLRVTGHVAATAIQHCVVTLEPIESEVAEAVDLLFQPEAEASIAPAADGGGYRDIEADDPPETHNGAVDLGAVATEFLLLGLDPYPRKPDAVFDAPAAGDTASHPFAALAALKKGEGEKGP